MCQGNLMIKYLTEQSVLEEKILLKPQLVANDLNSESTQRYFTPLLCL